MTKRAEPAHEPDGDTAVVLE